MKLTLKDKDFLERLRILLDSKDLAVELKYDGLKRFVLRQNYGDKIEGAFAGIHSVMGPTVGCTEED